jgi:hypothetical protein
MAKNEIRPIRIEGNIAYVPLTRGYEAIIDACDAPAVGVFNWYALVGPWTTYAVRNHRKNGQPAKVTLHRFLLEAPHDMHVDHVSGEGLDNRRSNLRLATQSQNQRNQRRSRANSSGYKGVSFDKPSGRWRAQIKVNGRTLHVALRDTAEEAHQAYAEAAVRISGEFGRAA